jgi:predicted nucleotidyltransferase
MSPLAGLLDARERAALAELLRRVATRHAPPIAYALLFGSKARGDAHAASDLDVLLVCDAPPWGREAADAVLQEEASRLEAESGVPIECWVLTTAELEEGRRTPMLVDAWEDGVLILPEDAAKPPLLFTPVDACFCARRLLAARWPKVVSRRPPAARAMTSRAWPPRRSCCSEIPVIAAQARCGASSNASSPRA